MQPEGGTMTSGIPENQTVAKDGALLLTGGRHSTAALFNGDMMPSAASIEVFWHNQARRRAFCAERGIAYLMAVFPDKLVTYRNHLPGLSNMGSVFLRSYLPGGQEQDARVVYPEVGCGDFLRTDTHLSADGMVSVTKQILRHIGICDFESFDAHCAAHRVAVAGHAGDLGVQCHPHVTEDAVLFKGIGRGHYASNGVTGGNDGIIDINVNAGAVTDKTLLIFGDSFFRQIVPLLTLFFRRLIFLRSRFFHDEIVAAVGPEVIFAGTAERYLSNVLSDQDRPHALAYPLMLGRPSSPTPKFAELWNEVVDSKTLGRSG